MGAAEIATTVGDKLSLTPARRKILIGVGGTVALLLALTGLWKLLPMNDYLRAVIAWTADHGPLGIVLFWGIYVLAALVGIPRTLMNIAAGVLFSYPLGVAVVLASATSAYALTFSIARTVARDWVRQRVAQTPNVQQLLDLVEEEGFKVVMLTRMNPFIPGVLKGYGFGTTNIRFRTYLGASVLGFLPIALAHVYIGWAGGEAMLYEGNSPGTVEKWLLAGGLLASLLLVTGIYVYGKRALQQRYPESN